MKPTTTTTWRPEWGVSQDARDTCLHSLGELYAARALSLEELDARIEAALAARTEEELQALLHVDAADVNDMQAPSGGEADAAPAQSFKGTRVPTSAVASLALVALVVGAAAVIGSEVVLPVLVASAVVYMMSRARLSRTLGRTVDARPARPRVDVPLAQTEAEATTPPRSEPPVRELILLPVAQVPAQRKPLEVSSVRMPIELGPGATRLELPSGAEDAPTPAGADEDSVAYELTSTAMLPALPGPATTRAEDVSPDHTAEEEIVRAASVPAQAVPTHDADDVRSTVSHLRPLLHRFTERAHGSPLGRTWGRSRTSSFE